MNESIKTMANELRQAADLLDKIAAEPNCDGMHAGTCTLLWLYAYSPKQAAAGILALGKVDKGFSETQATFMHRLSPTGVSLNIMVDREYVCRKVTTTVCVPEKHEPALSERVIPAHEVQKITWECDDASIFRAAEAG